MLYIALITLFFCMAVTGPAKKKKISGYTWLLVYLTLLIVYGLRGISVGFDNVRYRAVFVNRDYLYWGYFRHYMEPGYLFFNECIHKFTDNYIIFQFAAGAVLLSGYFLFIKENAYNDLLALFFWMTFGIYFNCMNQIRENLAIVLCLFGHHFLMKNRMRVAIFLIVMSFFVHKVALIVFIPYYILLYLAKHKRKMFHICLYAGIFAVLVFLVFDYGLVAVLSRFNIAAKYIERFMQLGYIRRGNVYYPLFYTTIFVFCAYRYRKYNEEDKMKNLSVFVGSYMVMFLAILSIPLNMMERCMQCFTIFSVVFLSNILTMGKISFSNRIILKSGVYRMSGFCLFTIREPLLIHIIKTVA